MERRKEASEVSSYQIELDRVDSQILHSEKEKARVWRAFELTGDEDKFNAEIKRVTTQIAELDRQRHQLEHRIEVCEQNEIDFDNVREFCKLASQNIENFTFENKRLALEVLGIKVWIDNQEITLEGVIPRIKDEIASTMAW